MNRSIPRTIRQATAAAIVACFLLAVSGCGKAERAAPVEVTYYYLPG